MRSPLPFPADEIRAELEERLTETAQLLGRLIRFYRGNQKDCSALESVALRLMSAQITIHSISWPHTEAEPPFPNPPAPAKLANGAAAPQTAAEPPAP